MNQPCVDTDLCDRIWSVHQVIENLQQGTWSKIDQVLSLLSTRELDETIQIQTNLFRFQATTNATIIQEFHCR